MNNMNNRLRKKAYEIMQSIEKMNDKEKSKLPSESFGENYNNLRDLVLDENSDMEALLPPRTEIKDYGYEGVVDRKTFHRYSEIHSFCSEIYHLLEE